MNIALIGEESAGMQMLRWLQAGPHRLVGVATTPPRDGQSGVSLWKVATRMGVTTWPARRVTDPEFAAELRAADVDLLLNVHSLHRICADVLAAPRVAAINMHPGPLPEYAGLNSASWAIYHGAAEHGVTLHHMDPGIDTGDIAYQQRFALTPGDTALSVNARCVRLGMELMEHLLEDAVAGTIPRIPQDAAGRAYYGREVPEEGVLRWDRPADTIVRFVRACDYVPFASPWGHPQAELDGRRLGIAKATRTGRALPDRVPPGTVGERAADGVLVATADEWVAVELVQLADGSLQAAHKVLKPGGVRA